MNVQALARPEIVAMKAYSSARSEAPGQGVLLNANECPWPLLDEVQATQTLNRYPDPQPQALVEALANLYQVPAAQLLVTRGSDEGIDLLTRVFCRAGTDAILHCPPTFGMYRIAAQTQGAAVISIARSAATDFALDTESVLRAVRENDTLRLVFLTSPNNPTGDTLPDGFLQDLLDAARGRAIVVVDEAYAEFCAAPSASTLLAGNEHLVVLRTLSKAWASAGLRCGTVLAGETVIGLLRRVIAPYPLASPVTALALRVLQPDLMQRQHEMLQQLADNKRQLLGLLQNRPFIRTCWPGEANFVLIEVDDADGLLAHCAARGVILRGYRNDPALQSCIRISVGSQADHAALQQALDQWQQASVETTPA